MNNADLPGASKPCSTRRNARVAAATLAGAALIAAIAFSESVQFVIAMLAQAMVDQDIRNSLLAVWLTAWLLPWPGNPGLLRRMLCTTVMMIAIPVAVGVFLANR